MDTPKSNHARESEIKFRGKRVDNGEWVEGYYAYDPHESKHIIFQEQFRGFSDDSGEVVDSGISILPWAVIPETVGQYIGIKDKNGKEIYKGDGFKVVRSTSLNTYYHFVMTAVNGGSFHYRLIEVSGAQLSWPYGYAANMEVIGNIHDNKELLVDY